MTHDDLDAWAARREPYAQACYRKAIADHDDDAVVHTTIDPEGNEQTVILKPADYARLPSYPETFPPRPGHFVFAVRFGPWIVFHQTPIPGPDAALPPIGVTYRSPRSTN